MTARTDTAMDDHSRQLAPASASAPYPPLSVCLGFGVGPAGVSIVLNSISVYFPALMATVLGMSPGVAGLLMMLSKIYDGFADLAIGGASDRTSSRWGRRRPWLLAGAFVSIAALLMVFALPRPPAGPELVLYMAVALVIYSTGYSMFNVPYLAMPADIARSTPERLRLISFRTAFVGVGQMTALALSAWLIGAGGGGVAGYRLMGIVMATLALATMLASFFGTAGARTVVRARISASTTHRLRWADVRSLATNRPLVLLLGAKLTQYIAFGIFQPTNLLFLLNVLRLGYTGMINLALAQNIAIFVSMPVWTRIGRAIGKRNAYLLAVAIMIPTALSWWWTDATIALSSVWWRAAVLGTGSGGALLMSTSMLQDTMDHDHLRTGQRREGVIASLYSVNEKLGFAAGAALLGLSLSLGGYIPTMGGRIITQGAAAIRALYVIETIVPTAFLLLGMMLISCYRLGDEPAAAPTPELPPHA
jgi:GPH family glycoside/pentoside/hexuronide:cation symporter